MTTATQTIECEVRALITPEHHEQLAAWFKQYAEFRGEDTQETRYFEGDVDLRIQKSSRYAKVWLKKGQMHDEAREEVEIKVAPEKFGDLERLFDALGYKTAIVWLRHRMSFVWDGVTVALDHTKGYGHVIELELMSDEAGRTETLERLRAKLAELGLRPTPKPQLHERFSYYRDHWRELLADKAQAEPVEEQMPDIQKAIA